MKRILCLTIITSICLSHLAHAQAKPLREGNMEVVKLSVPAMATPRPALKYALLPPLPDQTRGNAAAGYLLVVGNFHVDEKSVERMTMMLSQDLAKFPTAEAKRELSGLRWHLEMLDESARREQCEWNLNLKEKGFAALLPHLAPMRNVGTALCLQIRTQVADRNFESAAYSLQTGMGMVRHLDREATLVQQLVAVAMANRLLDQARDMSQLPGSPNLYWALADLPRPMIDVRVSLGFERNSLRFSFPGIARLKNGDFNGDDLQKVFEGMTAMSGHNYGAAKPALPEKMGQAFLMMRYYGDAKKYLRESGETAAAVEAMHPAQAVARYLVESYQEAGDELYKWMVLPYWQAEDGMLQAHRNLENSELKRLGNPFMVLLPALASARARIVNLDRRISAMQTIEALRAYAAQHDGNLPGRLADLTDTPAPIDPMTGAMPAYRVENGAGILEYPAPKAGGIHGTRYEITIVK